MIKSIWNAIKKPFTKMNDWLAKRMPGWKTKIITGVGAVGMAAGVLQEFLTGLPLSAFMTATQIAIASAVLFTLGFWARLLTR